MVLYCAQKLLGWKKIQKTKNIQKHVLVILLGKLVHWLFMICLLDCYAISMGLLRDWKWISTRSYGISTGFLWESCGVPMECPWCFYDIFWGYFGIQIGFLWYFYGFSFGFNSYSNCLSFKSSMIFRLVFYYMSMGLWWDSYWIPVGYPWWLYDISMGPLLDFYRISMEILRTFYGISQGCLWGVHWISIGFPWGFHRISTRFLWYPYGISLGISMIFLLDFYIFSWDYHGHAIGFLRDSHEFLRLRYFNWTTMGCSWDFHVGSLEILFDFKRLSMGFPLGSYEIYMVFCMICQKDFYGISMG